MRAGFLTVSLFLIWALHALDASPAQAGERRTIAIGLSSKSPPYVIDLQARTGVDIEIIDAVFSRAGVDVIFHNVPLNRQATVWEETRLDGLTLWHVPDGLSCNLTKPYRYWKDALFVPDMADYAHVRSVADLAGQRLGTFRGAFDHIAALGEGGHTRDSIQEIPYINSAARMLSYGRLDGYVGDYFGIRHALDQSDTPAPQGVRLVEFYPAEPQYLCFRDKAVADLFDSVMARLVAEPDDRINAIARAYGAGVNIFTPFR